jgi:DNA-directed RNA polymerase specialized sigma24 family protein
MGDITALFERARGDPRAQDELYRRTERELRKLARHWIRRRCPGEQIHTTEVIQDAFIKLMKILTRPDGAGVAQAGPTLDLQDVPKWPHRGAFYKFASRNILWAILRLLRRPPDSPNGADLAYVPAPDSRRAEEAVEALRKALEDLGRDLSDDHRAVVELLYLGECTLDQVAEKLPISRYKAHRMSKVALAYLREKLAPGSSEFD